MSVKLRHKRPGVSSQNVAINGRVYRVVTPTHFLHEVVEGQVAVSPGVDPGDAADLLKYSPSLFERTRPEPPKPKAKAVAKVKVEEPADNNVEPDPIVVEDDEGEEEDLSALDQSVAKLTAQLDTGELDDLLDALLSAEEAGKTRSSAVRAIEERQTHLEE